MRYFPVYVDLKDARVLVVGGGEQAAQKIRLLLKTDAQINVVTAGVGEEIDAELLELEGTGQILISRRDFRSTDLDGVQLVYVTTGDDVLDDQVSKEAKARAVPVNVVDKPALCTFITPAIVDRDPVIVAIGTEGAAPVLAREIKAKLESWLPANYGALARSAAKLRDEVRRRIGGGRTRRSIWERLFSGPFRKAILSGDDAAAKQHFEQLLADNQEKAGGIGSVALIGCGPGDPDLLTLKAQQRLQTADVLVIDRLVNPAILDYARRDATRIYVGKTPGKPSTGQLEINRILVREALKGKQVARLKGGDPFVFGRAGEELTALQALDVPVEIVSGITAAHACAAAINLPLTMRERNRLFSILTGATADGIAEHDWQTLARANEGFAIYMGVRAAGGIRGKLIEAGIDLETPVVIVENGTLPEERSVETNIGNLDRCIADCGIRGPAIIFVGLNWARLGLSRPGKVEVFDDDGGGHVVPLDAHRLASKSAG